MSTKNKQIALRLYEEVWNERKLNVVDELISPSHALHDPNLSGSQTGPDGYKQQVVRFTTAFPDLHFAIEDIFSEQDKLVVSWMISGTHEGEYEGIPPTDMKIFVHGITIHHIVDGKMLDSFVSWDALGLMRQLGHPPPLGKTIVAAGPHGLEANTISMNGVIVVYLSGAILFREESASLRMFVKDLLSKSRHIVLDLGEVTHIDSGGLGTLVSLFVSARRFGGGNIKLANLGSHANEVLHITKLATVFEVFDKTEDAVASFKRAATAS
jgi:steroid delta-isomerase-like uncharacterized protein